MAQPDEYTAVSSLVRYKDNFVCGNKPSSLPLVSDRCCQSPYSHAGPTATQAKQAPLI